MLKLKRVVKDAGVYSAVKSVEECENEDVFCISVPETGNFVANGMVIANCDALRYAVFSKYPRAEFTNEIDGLSSDQLRRKVYGEEGYGFMGGTDAGYF